MLRALTAAFVVALPAAAAAAPVTPTGTSSEGARFTLTGQVVTVVLPRPLAPGRVLEAQCGRETLTSRAVGRGRARGRGLRTVRVLLRGDPSSAEWCEYDGPRRRWGAAVMQPGFPGFERVTPGPGAREGRQADDRNGGGRFLVRGSRITVEMGRPFARSHLAWLGCGTGYEPLGGRRVAVDAGQSAISVDAGADLADAEWCLLEAPGGADYLEAALP